MQNLGGQTKSIMVFSEMAYSDLIRRSWVNLHTDFYGQKKVFAALNGQYILHYVNTIFLSCVKDFIFVWN